MNKVKSSKIIKSLSAVIIAGVITPVIMVNSICDPTNNETPADNNFGLVSNAAYYVSDEISDASERLGDMTAGVLDGHDFYKLANAIDTEASARNRDVGFLETLDTTDRSNIYNAVAECDTKYEEGKAKLAQYLSGSMETLPNGNRSVLSDVPSAAYNTPDNATDAQFVSNMDRVVQNIVNYTNNLTYTTGTNKVFNYPVGSTVVIKAHFCSANENECIKTFTSAQEYYTYLANYIDTESSSQYGGCYQNGTHIHNDSCFAVNSYPESHEETIYCPDGMCMGNVGQTCSGHNVTSTHTRFVKETICDLSDNTWGKSCGYYPGQIISMEITYPHDY